MHIDGSIIVPFLLKKTPFFVLIACKRRVQRPPIIDGRPPAFLMRNSCCGILAAKFLPRNRKTQAAIFASVFAALGAGTVGLLAALPVLEAALPDGWYSAWQGTWPVPLGLIFAAAGIAHFTMLEGFCNIYPGRGAWGFWYLPGTASFHVKWTGVAEIAGGVGLALGGLGVGPPGLM